MPVNLYPAPFSRVHQGPIIVNPPPMSMGPGPATMATMPPDMMQASMGMGNPTLGPLSMNGQPRPIGSVLTNGVANPYIQHNSMSTAFRQPAYNTSYTNLPVNDPRYVPSMLPNGQSGDYGGGATATAANHTLQPGIGGHGMTIDPYHPSLSYTARDAAAARHSEQAQNHSYRSQQGGTPTSPHGGHFCAECQAASRHRHDSGGSRAGRSTNEYRPTDSYKLSPSPYRHDPDPRPARGHHTRQHLSPSMTSEGSDLRGRTTSQTRHLSPLRRHRSPLGPEGQIWPDRELSDQLHGLRRRRSTDMPPQAQSRRASDAGEASLLRMSDLRIDMEAQEGGHARSAISDTDEERRYRRRRPEQLQQELAPIQHSHMQGSGRYPDFASRHRHTQGLDPGSRGHGHSTLHHQYAADGQQHESTKGESKNRHRPVLAPIHTSHSGLDHRDISIDPPGELWPLRERQVSPSRQHRAIYLGHQPAGLNSSSKLRPQWRDGDYSRD